MKRHQKQREPIDFVFDALLFFVWLFAAVMLYWEAWKNSSGYIGFFVNSFLLYVLWGFLAKVRNFRLF